jgi:hypothetical protein
MTKVITGQLHRVKRGRGKGFSPDPPAPPVFRPARVAVLASAHQIQRAIDRGELEDQAEAAGRLGLTRVRLTQLLDLTLLAPDIQGQIVVLKMGDGTEPLSERAFRPVVRACSWEEQRTISDSMRP